MNIEMELECFLVLKAVTELLNVSKSNNSLVCVVWSDCSGPSSKTCNLRLTMFGTFLIVFSFHARFNRNGN